MKIAFYIGGGVAAPWIVRSAARAVQKLGHRARLFRVVDEEQEIDDSLLRFRPDWVIALDHTGIRDESFVKRGIRYCSWFVDHPLYFVDEKDFNPLHVAAVSDPCFEPVLSEMGCRRVVFCPLAFDPELFPAPAASSERLADFGYVGSFPGTAGALSRSREKRFSKAVNAVIDAALRLRDADPTRSPEQLLRELDSGTDGSITGQLSFSQRGALVNCLDREIDARNKERMFALFSERDFRIYGDSGWKALAGEHPAFRGRIDYRRLFSIYPALSVNLVLTRPQIHGGVNQRVFDIPAAGGFFLGDRPEALERLFPGIGTSIGCGGPDEMACRADDFLRRPAERKRIADRLRETVRRDHTYERRMHSLLEVLADRA